MTWLRWFDRRVPLSEQLDALRTLAGITPDVHAERYGHKPMEKPEPKPLPKPATVAEWTKRYGRTA